MPVPGVARATLLCLAALLAACGEDERPVAVFTVQLLTPGNGDPLAGADAVRLRIQQGEGEVIEREEPLDDGSFSADVALSDLVTPVRIAVEVDHPDGLRIGAPPPFVPAESGGVVRIALGAPDSCETLVGVDLAVPRSAVGAARQGTFALAAGGVEGDADSSAADYLDLLQLAAAPLPALDAPIGAARATPIGAAGSIVLAAARPPFRYDLYAEDERVREGGLHAGAGSASVAVGLASQGAVILGGRADDGSAVDRATWIDVAGTVSATSLAAARADATAALVGSDVLVVGGADEPSGPWAELLPPRGDGLALDLLPDAERSGGTLISLGGGRALLVGGADATGAARTDTVLFDCSAPGTCTAAAGPPWLRARAGFAAIPLPGGGALLAGGDGPVAAVDRVEPDGEGARIAEVGNLALPRENPAGLALPSGLAFVIGGRGEGSPLGSVELCFPASLAWP